jgi:ankyrin repeat protein
VLQETIHAIPWENRSLRDAVLDPAIHHSISTIPTSETLEHINSTLDGLQERGNYVLAIYCHFKYILIYPGIADEGVRRLRGNLDWFVLHSRSMWADKRLLVPYIVQNASIFLPQLPVGFFDDCPKIKSKLLDTTSLNCLGRSTSHIMSDAGYPLHWPSEHINHRDVLGRAALYFACTQHDETIVQSLLDQNADVNQQTITGLVPLHVAAIKGNASICAMLWDRTYGGRRIIRNIHLPRDCSGQTPVMSACIQGYANVLRFLCPLISGAANDVNSYGNSVIGLATQQGHVEAVQCLLDHKFAPDIPDSKGRTPFWHATHRSHYEMMKCLSPKVNPDHKDIEGRTPLAEAARSGFVKGVRYLLSLNDTNNKSDLLLLGDMSRLDHRQYKVDPTAKDNRGYSPLILAVKEHQIECVRLLVQPRSQSASPYDRKELNMAKSIARDQVMYNVLDHALLCFFPWRS